MKSLKVLFFLFVFVCRSSVLYAQDVPGGSTPVTLTPHYDPTDNSKGPRRAPRVYSTVEIFVYNNTLYLGENFEGCTVRLLQDDIVVYEDEVDDENGVLTIPDGYEGEYDIEVVKGSVRYQGVVYF